MNLLPLKIFRSWLLLTVALFAAACTLTSTPHPAPPVALTREVIVIVQGTSARVEIVVTNTPEPTATEGPRTLVVCMGAQPETLFRYGTGMLVKSHVFEAIFDGPVDSRSYSYQPVILEKMPALGDRDARIRQVERRAGDLITAADGDPAVLAAGIRYRPSGCRQSECALEFSAGEAIRMDQLVVTYTLKSDLRWSDGAPLTASDSHYAFTLENDSSLHTALGFNSRFTGRDPRESYIVVDPLQTRLTYLSGHLPHDYQQAFVAPAPRHAWGEYAPPELVGAEISARHPPGWGPYRIIQWNYDRQIRLECNPYYHRAAEGLPHFEHLVFRFVTEGGPVNIARLLSGECDLVEQDAELQLALRTLVDLDEAGLLQAHLRPGAIFEQAAYGILPVDRPGFFADVRTRQGLAMCMDREALVQTITFGASLVPDVYVPPEHPLCWLLLRNLTPGWSVWVPNACQVWRRGAVGCA